MPPVNWTIFEGLPGAATDNFEYLCRALVRRHYNKHGSFQGLSNQPGIEFHLNIHSDCPLGEVGRWYGWQCKWYELPSGRALGTTRRKTIEEAILKTQEILPELTDWVLWTRHTLTRGDQKWFYGIETDMKLHLWTKDEVEEHLSGPAEILRGTYFGELVLTPDALAQMHAGAIAPIRQRWIPEVHQTLDAEEQIRLSLGAVEAWAELKDIPEQINEAVQALDDLSSIIPDGMSERVDSIRSAASGYSQLMSDIHAALEGGDYDVAFQLVDKGISFDKEWKKTLRQLRIFKNQAALYLTNVLASFGDVLAALRVLSEVLRQGMIAVLADAGCGKTQMSAQLTSPTEDRGAGILLHGRELSARDRLDDLARTVVIQGRPVETFESLIAALDAAGERSGRRLPLIIDGLNEAEDPRQWKAYLESLRVILENYPYVLLVVTLRSEFAPESLPDDIQQFDIPGFRGHLVEAARAYFHYYKIDIGDAELPIELLNHPLKMRLFCEVTNPERKKTVGVEAMPGSLTNLFEKYLDQIADRIAQLAPSSCRYYASDILSALNATGYTLWSENIRSVELNRLRQILGDAQRNWDQSLVRALEHEGVFYRVPGSTPGVSEISINYDALAGHIVADSLLSQHGGASFGDWLKEEPQASLLFGSMGERHTLSGDILVALVGLVPCRMYRQQFWSLLDGQARERALYLSAWLSPEQLDSETVKLLGEMVKQEPDYYGRDLLSLLIATRAAKNHPLDATFLDNILRSMTVVERDVRWTQWIRRSADDRKEDILRIEDRWKTSGLRRREDSLRALWLQWVLTATNRTLRDHATRALFWYGTNAPAELFEQTLSSLSINDPYVPERLLAASYGVAMALWADSEAQVLHLALPDFANSLVEKLFEPGAPNATRHVLIKEYALGLIQLAQKISPACIPEEKKGLLQPPFDQIPEGFPEVEDIDDSVTEIAKSAIRMDFGNYTLGRLIPERGNYDYDNDTYKVVRKKIEHRIVDLGYGEEVFGELDSRINDMGWRRGPYREGKIERYGKKYSWIAYFEMYGLRLDRGELPDWRQDERALDVDVDPTFSEAPKEWLPDLPDVFAKPLGDVPEWISEGPTPDYTSLLQPESVDEQEGPWILLEGFIEQNASDDARRVFTFLRGVLAEEGDVEKILQKFAAIKYPGNIAIPEPLDDHYCFSGEIPWSAQYARALRNADGSPKPDRRGAFGHHPNPGIPVEVPVCRYCWESHHSELNQSGNVIVPAPALSESVGLVGKWGQWDYYDSEGKLATLCRVFQEDGAAYMSKLFYIRKDLLEKYLEETGQKLVWMLWGEREFHHRYFTEIMEDHYGLLRNHKHIHRFAMTL
ncbi:hypothetical protein PSDVSF_00890 [Pseudodesulfovibrio sediminis]|uniref:NACHT domain-containing protein n=2 Tax=Pseudodesulfovibrio sediminis TaxID=2810563 RepID=A0ABN6ELE1_9BACT|nr:hypothetical protein PSDVSF_00890 [Pseudodesulfovibrio sediminis]